MPVMRKQMRLKRVAAIAGCAVLLIQRVAFAHEGMNHDEMHQADAQMQKLHHIMPLYAQAQAKINEALTNKDKAAIGSETGKILATISDLKTAKPHKNLKEIKTFRKMASAFAGDVKKTALLAKSGDLDGARDAFQRAQKRCEECHEKFRD